MAELARLKVSASLRTSVACAQLPPMLEKSRRNGLSGRGSSSVDFAWSPSWTILCILFSYFLFFFFFFNSFDGGQRMRGWMNGDEQMFERNRVVARFWIIEEKLFSRRWKNKVFSPKAWLKKIWIDIFLHKQVSGGMRGASLRRRWISIFLEERS